MTKRQEAMKWWNNLSSAYKTQICDTNIELIGSVRKWETLTGREIQMLFDDKCKSDAEIIEMAFSNKNKKLNISDVMCCFCGKLHKQAELIGDKPVCSTCYDEGYSSDFKNWLMIERLVLK